MGIPHI